MQQLLSSFILFIDGEAFVMDKPAGLPVDTPKRGGESVERRLDEQNDSLTQRRKGAEGNDSA